MWKTWWKEAKRHNKGLILFDKPWYYFITLNAGLLWVTLTGASPYKRAKIRLAYMKYKMTPMYWERYTIMGPDYALKRFPNECAYYMKQLTWRDRAKALFIPFTILSKEF